MNTTKHAVSVSYVSQKGEAVMMWNVEQWMNGRWERAFSVSTRREARELRKYVADAYKCRARVAPKALGITVC